MAKSIRSSKIGFNRGVILVMASRGLTGEEMLRHPASLMVRCAEEWVDDLAALAGDCGEENSIAILEELIDITDDLSTGAIRIGADGALMDGWTSC